MYVGIISYTTKYQVGAKTIDTFLYTVPNT